MPSEKLSLVLMQQPAEPGLSRYAAVAAALRARILAGEWPPGAALPSEQSLAAQHGIALATLRRALDLLCDQGLVDRYHGKGTFVRQALAGATVAQQGRFLPPGSSRDASSRPLAGSRSRWVLAPASRCCRC
jgi:GntR family transcriptional regulator